MQFSTQLPHQRQFFLSIFLKDSMVYNYKLDIRIFHYARRTKFNKLVNIYCIVLVLLVIILAIFNSKSKTIILCCLTYMYEHLPCFVVTQNPFCLDSPLHTCIQTFVICSSGQLSYIYA